MKLPMSLLAASLTIAGCATITNDENVPVALSFSDGSRGTCSLSNTRATYTVDMPATQMVRRARSPLSYDCTTSSGKTAKGIIPSAIEGGKVAASVVFIDFGITDAITEKGRTYPASFVIPIR
ncbi:hypothetical protein [uncultured Roseobacter sp.]|uniref:hypothetical protein n=1 Tax=uncultured Roseobacter sp. TaxID=114847 RepID=UPI00260D5A19|nr:hypothetical protein [uncultured Roseobacter sp.]